MYRRRVTAANTSDDQTLNPETVINGEDVTLGDRTQLEEEDMEHRVPEMYDGDEEDDVIFYLDIPIFDDEMPGIFNGNGLIEVEIAEELPAPPPAPHPTPTPQPEPTPLPDTLPSTSSSTTVEDRLWERVQELEARCKARDDEILRLHGNYQRAEREAQKWEYAARAIALSYRQAFDSTWRCMNHLRSAEREAQTPEHIEHVANTLNEEYDSARTNERSAYDWVKDH